MRNLRRWPRAVFSVLLLTVATVGVVGASRANDEPAVAAASADCAFDVKSLRSQQDIWREVSNRAELATPTRAGVEAAAVTKRRRSSGQPKMPDFVAKNFIDDEIFGKMKRDGVMWTSPSSDQEFLRRVWIDLAGQIPDVQTVRDFLADASADKRDRMIARLLDSEGFTDRWTMWFGDHVQNVQFATNTAIGSVNRNAYHKFIRDSFAAKKPYDLIVREAIAGNGRSVDNGAVNYFLRQQQPNGPIQDTYDNLAAFAGEKFLGLPLNCLSCHSGIAHLELVNSGLSRRTRNDFWKSAAFFAQTQATIDRTTTGGPPVFILADNAAGAYRLNTTSGNKTPRQPQQGQANTVEPAFFLSGETPTNGESRRQAFARMLTAHPQFARATVNYLWKEIFGLGIVEPADSFDLLRQDPATLPQGAALQPTHPELLNRLTEHFVASGYDIRALLKTMVESNTYQLSSRYTPGPWSETYTPYYARHFARRIMAEALMDAIATATGVGFQINVQGNPAYQVAKAMQLPDPTEGGRFSAMLNALGRGDRDDGKRSSDSSIAQALLLMNDRNVTDRIRSAAGNSTVARLLRQTQNPEEIVEGLYLATLSRFPTNEEKATGAAILRDGTLNQRVEDLQFALLNKLEFLFN